MARLHASIRRDRIAAACVTTLLIGAISALAQCPIATPLPPAPAGIATIDPLPLSPNCNGNASYCVPFDVECGGGEIDGEIRITNPPPGTPQFRGSVVFLTGGRAVDYYTDRFPVAQPLFDQLQAFGVRTIEVAYNEDLGGWSTAAPLDERGLIHVACNGAELFKEIEEKLHPSGPMGEALPYCATGNSGGSSLLAYTLSHYGFDLFEAVVLTSGPTMTRVDWGCLGDGIDPDKFDFSCGNRVQVDQSVGYEVTIEPEETEVIHCADDMANDPFLLSFDGDCVHENVDCATEFHQMSLDSLLYTATAPIPDTVILTGEDDNSSAVPQAEEYAGLFGLPVIEVEDAPHGLPNSLDGWRAIRGELASRCFGATIGE